MGERRVSWKMYVFIALLLVFLPIWKNFFVDWFKYIPDDFSYSADLISIDNFYDGEAGKFEGEKISNSSFDYNVISKRDGSLIIENNFEVFTLTGEKIISIERVLGVDPSTGMYDPLLGDKARVGSMFAPIGLKSGESFVYWHVNYDEPFVMKFVGEEDIEGLKTYRYEVLDSEVSVDQTSSLGHLEGVPEERGVRVYPTLNLWVEPVTGLLVKYEDSAEGYFYDMETKADIISWNNFSNEFSEGTILKNVDSIKFIKWKYLFVDYIFPSLVLMFVLFLIVLEVKFLIFDKMDEEQKLQFKGRMFLIGFIVLSVLLVFGIYIQYVRFVDSERENYKIGIISLNESSTIKENLDAFESRLELNGYIDGENLEIFRTDAQGDEQFYSEKIKEFLDQDVDLIYTVTSPATKIAAKEAVDTPIVFSIVSYPVRENIIDSFIDSGNNLVGVKHNIPISSQWYEFGKILDLNPQIKFDKVVFVSGTGSKTVDIQYLDFEEYFKNEGVQVERVFESTADSLERSLSDLEGNYILYAACDVFNQREGGDTLLEFSFRNNKILISCLSSLVPKGALFSRSVDFTEIGEIAANKASLVLQGANTRWLMTESPRNPMVNINSETAELFSIEIDYNDYSNLLIFPN